MSRNEKVVRHDVLAADSDRRELRRGGSLIPVEPQVFDLLEYLIRNRERVVSKDDLVASMSRSRRAYWAQAGSAGWTLVSHVLVGGLHHQYPLI
jgi:DNA-binding response OmpR family regulator